MTDIERWECGRCGTEVREGRRTHYCGEGYTLKVTDDIRRVRYVRADREGAVEELRKALLAIYWLTPDDLRADLHRPRRIARAALRIGEGGG